VHKLGCDGLTKDEYFLPLRRRMGRIKNTKLTQPGGNVGSAIHIRYECYID